MKLEPFFTVRESEDWLVWRGLDRAAGKRYLLKQVHPQAEAHHYLKGLLTEEREFYRPLAHDGVIRILGEMDDALVFEDMAGSMAQLLRQEGPLPADLVADVLLQC